MYYKAALRVMFLHRVLRVRLITTICISYRIFQLFSYFFLLMPTWVCNAYCFACLYTRLYSAIVAFTLPNKGEFELKDKQK